MAWTRKNKRVTQDDLIRELETIREANDGKLRPTDVVTAAAEESHPLHGCFNWDNQDAGHLWRLHEARNMIREVKVEVGERKVSKYWNVPAPKPSESYYAPADVIVERPDEFQRALQLLSDKFQAAKRALDELSTLAKTSQDHAERLEIIAVAMQAFAAAQAAVERIQ